MNDASLPGIPPKRKSFLPSEADVARASIEMDPFVGVIAGWNLAAVLAAVGAAVSGVLCMLALGAETAAASEWFGRLLSASIGSLAFRTIALYLKFQHSCALIQMERPHPGRPS